MEKRERLVEINDHITLIDDNGESTCYLVRGDKRALLIDTANGPLDLAALCATLTDLPVTVVNTHGHCDHVFGNIWFAKAYLHSDDYALHDEHFQFPEIQSLMKQTGKHPAELLPLAAGQVFDLGGLELEVVPMKGHTSGSVGLLDRRDRILFTGDGANSTIWMQLPDSTDIATLKHSLEALLRDYGDAFDFILAGHGGGLEDAAGIPALIEGCAELLRGETGNEQPYEYFAGTCLAHPYGEGGKSLIVYTEEKLRSGLA